MGDGERYDRRVAVKKKRPVRRDASRAISKEALRRARRLDPRGGGDSSAHQNPISKRQAFEELTGYEWPYTPRAGEAWKLFQFVTSAIIGDRRDSAVYRERVTKLIAACSELESGDLPYLITEAIENSGRRFHAATSDQERDEIVLSVISTVMVLTTTGAEPTDIEPSHLALVKSELGRLRPDRPRRGRAAYSAEAAAAKLLPMFGEMVRTKRAFHNARARRRQK